MLIAGCAGDGDDGGETTGTATETRTTAEPTSTGETTPEPTTATETTAPPTATETTEPTTTQTTDDGRTVAMMASTFSPVRLEVPTGTTVVWENEDNYGHTIVDAQFHDVSESWSFESGTVDGGESASYTFDSAGVYEYYCDIHGRSQMCGAVLVGGATLDATLPCED
jgi:plastocyanin